MIQEKIATIAASGGVTVSTNVIWDIAATQFSQEIISYVYAGSTAHGYPVRSMISGAGHDAKYMNDIVPSAMIFVPSVKGRSHCQEEFTRWEDIEKGVNVLLYTVQALAQKTEERVDYHADGS